ncbi:zinc finger domain-containing protein [Streptomyces cinereoruber]|uniref:zinc finger domain-containing protein n=1 Tax=Streptomyces cinereoruber TaxID=67260 RepID=UPI003636BD7A
MTIRRNAPMPDSIRHFMRAGQHPARSVPCPHCGAAEHRPCRILANGRILSQPHPRRTSAWAEAVACCPHCQAAPGTPCHTDGIPLLDDVHARRHLEAKEMAA